jgi:hypothetical protein
MVLFRGNLFMAVYSLNVLLNPERGPTGLDPDSGGDNK